MLPVRLPLLRAPGNRCWKLARRRAPSTKSRSGEILWNHGSTWTNHLGNAGSKFLSCSIQVCPHYIFIQSFLEMWCGTHLHLALFWQDWKVWFYSIFYPAYSTSLHDLNTFDCSHFLKPWEICYVSFIQELCWIWCQGVPDGQVWRAWASGDKNLMPWACQIMAYIAVRCCAWWCKHAHFTVQSMPAWNDAGLSWNANSNECL